MKLIKILNITVLLSIALYIPLSAKEANVLSEKDTISIGGYPISLSEAITYTLQNNFTIEMARIERKIIAHEVPIARSIYDTLFTADSGYTADRAEPIMTSSAKKSNRAVWNMGLAKKIPTGTTLSLDLINSRTSAPSQATSLEPYYMSDLALGINQPLLKNGFGFLDRSRIKLVELDVSRLDLGLLDTIEADIADVLKKYWDLSFTYKTLQAKEDALAYAEEFLRITDEQFGNGALEETDLYAAKANVEQRQKEVLEARTARTNASNDLKLAMNFFPEYELSPVDDASITREPLEASSQIATAINNRRDLESAHIAIEAKKLTLAMDKNSLWPQIDLISTFTSNGLAREMIDALGEAFSLEDPTYFIGAEFSFPLENRNARHQFSQSDLEKAKAIIDLTRIEKNIDTTIKKAVNAINLAQDQIVHNEKIIEYQIKKLEGEEKKYGFGRSSSDIILRYENDVINAQISYLDSIFSLSKALVDLKRNQNILLNDINWITFENEK